MEEFTLEKSRINVNNVASVLTLQETWGSMKETTRKFSQKNKCLSKSSESCKRNRAGGENVDVRATGFTENQQTKGET